MIAIEWSVFFSEKLLGSVLSINIVRRRAGVSLLMMKKIALKVMVHHFRMVLCFIQLGFFLLIWLLQHITMTYLSIVMR